MEYEFKTRAIHAGQVEKNPFHALNPPIFQTSTFTFEDLDHAEDVMDFKSTDYVYTRGNNPTLRLLENRIADLEDGKGAVAFSSGMGAISSVLVSLLKPGDEMIFHKTLYGSSYSFITQVLKKYGVTGKMADLTKIDDFQGKIRDKTKLVYFETPSNPDLSIIDIRKVAGIAKEHGMKTVVDNTFMTPYFQRPLSLGADVVVHSATKYLSGHGDVVAGLAIAKDEDYINELKFGTMCEFGSVLAPFNAWLILRGIKTLPIRMKEHSKNALALAKHLEMSDMVVKVNYPGLPSNLGYESHRGQASGHGGVLSFELKGGIESAKRFVSSLRLFKIGVSLGDTESLVEVPAILTHRGYPKEELEKFGLTESMVRLSVGLEDEKDLIEDINRGLASIGGN